MKVFPIARVIFATSLLCAPAAGVWAQAPATRAPGGLFGHGPAHANSRQGLTTTISMFEALDDNAFASGSLFGVNGDASYSLRTNRFTLSAGGSSLIDRLAASQFVGVSSSANVGAAATLGRRIRIFGGQNFSYSPYYQPGRAVGEVLVFDPDAAAAAPAAAFETSSASGAMFSRKSYAYDTTAGLQYTIDRRSSVSFEAGIAQLTAANASDQTTRAVGGRYSRQLAKRVSVHAGYGRRTGLARSPGDASTTRTMTHDFDLGVDYQRTLSFSRRTTFSFSTGSSIVNSESGSRPRLSGHAGLQRQVGRTWSGALQYDRQIQFLDGFAEPYLADSIGVSAHGFLGRRIDISTSSGYSTGAIGFSGGNRQLTTYSASAQLRVAVTRKVALFSQCEYYRYQLGGDSSREAGLEPRRDRRAVKGGLLFWLPVIH